MLTAVTDPEVKSQIIKSFGEVSSPLRIVCATIAFGMEVDTPDVRKIIYLGAQGDIPAYIQETDRGGRDGKLHIRAIYNGST